MEQEPFVHALRRLWWVPTIFAAAAVCVSGFIALRSPHYQATASVVAQVPANANSQALSFTDVATSTTVVTRALADTQVNETVTQVSGDLAVVATRSTLYLVTVSDASAQNAVALANAVASEGAAYYQQLAGGAANSVVTNLDADVQQYRDRYLSATEDLLIFASQNPAVVTGTAPVGWIAQYHALQLDQQAAQNAYLDLETAAAQARVNQVSNALDSSASVVDRAAPHSQTLSLALKVGFAGVLGIILGLAIAVAVEYLRRPQGNASHVAAESNGVSGERRLILPDSAASRPAAAVRENKMRTLHR